jgi:hypothetical protein
MSQCNLNIQAVFSVSADGFVVQTGDPEGPAEGFVNPGTGLVRTVPLEIMVELGMYKARTKLPFNAFGTMAMAREVRITIIS